MGSFFGFSCLSLAVSSFFGFVCVPVLAFAC
jgi:hypothetical protein